MTCRPDVLVAVPAHDEAGTIEACLVSVLVSLRQAHGSGLIASGAVAVAAHQCSDATAALAAEVLGGQDLVRHLVQVDRRSRTVGQVRGQLVQRAQRRWPELARPYAWLLNTDADSVVPPQWAGSLISQAAATHVDAVAGLVDLSGWDADEQARRHYAAILARGMRPDGHDHAYAANLAVRMGPYADVGGFPGSAHGEDRVLLDRLRRAGFTVATPMAPVVATSARMPGRAADGLGALLQRLDRRTEGDGVVA